MSLTKQAVWEAMKFFNLRLQPSSQRTQEELAMLSAAIWDDLLDEHWDTARFEKACRAHRKASAWLPTSADLLKADKALAEATPYRELKALPAWDTPADAQAAKNQSRAREVLAALSSGKRPPWATTRAQ